MPINVSCTSCGTTLRAPDTAAGKKVKCPKCGAVLVVPAVEEVLEDAPVSVSESPPRPSKRNRQDDPDDDDDRPRRRDRRDEEDEDEEPRRGRRRQSVANTEEGGTGAQMGLGIASLSVGICGVLLALIPCLGLFIGPPFAIIGFLLGVVGLIVAMTRKGRGLAFPVAGTVVSLACGIVLLMWWMSIGAVVNQGAKEIKKGFDEFAEKARKQEEEKKIKDLADRQKSKGNLQLLAGAMLQYAENNGGQLPKSDNNGLSWRVLILPHINENQLFQDFNLKQPWDDPQNKDLLPRLPAIYKPVRNAFIKEGTYYQVFADKDGPFASGKQPTLAQFDAGAGRANTFLIVEGSAAVDWTRPQDEWYEKGKVPLLGGMFGGGFHAAMADGTVRWFEPNALNESQLRGAILSEKGKRLPNR